MSPALLVAVLASAVLHAAWNALLKATRDTPAASLLIVLCACALTALLAVTVGPARVPLQGLPWLVTTGLVEGLYFVSLSQALQRLPLGTAYGLSRGAGLLFVWPLSAAFFGEALEPRAVVGAALLSAGLFLLVTRASSRLGLAMAGLCAVSIALYPLAYKRALLAGIDPLPLFAGSLAVAMPVQFALLGRGRLGRLAAAWQQHRRLALAGGALCAASFLLFLTALQSGGPGRLTGLRNTSVLFAAMFGWWTGEAPTRRGLASAGAIAVGAVLLSWGD